MSDFTVQVKDHGRLNLPKSLRQTLGIEGEGSLVFRVKEDGSVEVISADALANRSRGLFKHLKTEESETDTFITERREEADR